MDTAAALPETGEVGTGGEQAGLARPRDDLILLPDSSWVTSHTDGRGPGPRRRAGGLGYAAPEGLLTDLEPGS